MQIVALETFLKIAEVGSFSRAADQLFVTQSTISARVRVLEDSLGQKLFHRTRVAAELTQAGRTFVPYAQSVVRNWRKARQEIALPKGFVGSFSLGTSPSLWDNIVLSATSLFQDELPSVALNVAVTSPKVLLERIDAGEIDAVVLHEPNIRTNLASQQLFTDELVLVSTTPRGLMRWDPKYVYIDWGPNFREQHYRAYPVDDTPIITFDDAQPALQYLLQRGGSAYLPRRWLDRHEGSNTFHLVADAPVFTSKIYIVHAPELMSDSWRKAAVERLAWALLEKSTRPRTVAEA